MRLLGRSHDVSPVWPQDPFHSRETARRAALDGIDLVVAMGGDGIVHHVAQGLVGTQTVLGIIPCGTTNVLARMLDIPSRPSSAARMLAEHSVTTSPTIEVTGRGDTGDWSTHACFSLGVGPDAVVVSAAEAEPFRKYRFGGLHYASTAIGTVWRDLRHRQPTLRVTTDVERPAIGAMVQFHPRYTYFGRIPLALDDRDPDPVSVLTIERLPIRRAGAVLRKAMRGSLGDVAAMHISRNVDRVTITSTEPVDTQIDGEHYGTITELEAVADATGLQIAVPHSSPR